MARVYEHLTDDYDMLSDREKRIFMRTQRALLQRNEEQVRREQRFQLLNDELGVHTRAQYPVDYDEDVFLSEIEPASDESEPSRINADYDYSTWATAGDRLDEAEPRDSLSELRSALGITPPNDYNITGDMANELDIISTRLGLSQGWQGTYDARFGVPLPPGITVTIGSSPIAGVESVFEVRYPSTTGPLSDNVIGRWIEHEQTQLRWAGQEDMWTWRIRRLRQVIENAIRWNILDYSPDVEAQAESVGQSATQEVAMEVSTDGQGW